MKKLFTILSFLLATLSYAQIKEGYIIYDMKIDGLPPEIAQNPQAAAMFNGMQNSVYFKNDKVLTEVTSQFVKMKSLNDGKETLVLMDQMGQKKYYKKKNETSSTDKTAPKIEYTEEKKTIAGYECKKAVITTTVDGKSQKMDVWYTDKLYSAYINNSDDVPFKGLKGVPLEYDMSQNGMKFKIAAKEVSTKAVPDSKFVVSTEGYKEISAAELNKHQK